MKWKSSSTTVFIHNFYLFCFCSVYPLLEVQRDNERVFCLLTHSYEPILPVGTMSGITFNNNHQSILIEKLIVGRQLENSARF